MEVLVGRQAGGRLGSIQTDHPDADYHHTTTATTTTTTTTTGADATEAFEDVGHSEDARIMLKDYLIGDLKVRACVCACMRARVGGDGICILIAVRLFPLHGVI